MKWVFITNFFVGYMLSPPAMDSHMYRQYLHPALPCLPAINITLGEVDEPFNLNREELEDIIKEVAGIWSAPIGRNVVNYHPEDGIQIHFLYDEQQKLTDQERLLRDEIKNAGIHIDAAERELRQKENSYVFDIKQYDEESGELQVRIDRLNQWVRKVNDTTGGFGEDELRQYYYRKQGIDQTAARLETQKKLLHTTGQNIIRLVAAINHSIEERNQLIDEYNARFAGVHHFTQGLYEWNEQDRAIHIYQFGDKQELKIVLAHEIGHALGIEHVADEHSIMHHTIGAGQRIELALTEHDIAALKNLCGFHPD